MLLLRRIGVVVSLLKRFNVFKEDLRFQSNKEYSFGLFTDILYSIYEMEGALFVKTSTVHKGKKMSAPGWVSVNEVEYPQAPLTALPLTSKRTGARCPKRESPW